MIVQPRLYARSPAQYYLFSFRFHFPIKVGDSCVFLIVQKRCNMKKRRLTAKSPIHIGELYLFHPNSPHCPPSTSLWGFYDKTRNGRIYLEHSTLDLCHFQSWHKLSKRYRFYRLSTRDELRDYMYSLGIEDAISLSVSSVENTHQ